MIMEENKLGKLIRQVRKQKNMTLRDLEEGSGVSYSQLSKIERGDSIPLKSNLEKIAEALGGYQNELLHFAGYMPDVDYIKALEYGYQRSLPGLEQDSIYENIYNKLKQHRAAEGKETNHVSFDREGYVLVYETDYHGDSVFERVEKYKTTNILYGSVIEGELESIRNTPKKHQQASVFGDWVKDFVADLDYNDQEILFDDLKDFVQFKVFQLKSNKN